MRRSVAFERLQRRVQPALNHIFYWPVRTYLDWKYDIRYSGKENIPVEGPCLVAVKQNSNLDPVVAARGLWERGVAVRFIMRNLHLPLILRVVLVFLLSWMGTRMILRRREVLKYRDRSKRRRLLAEARERIHGEASFLAIEAEDAGHLFFFPEGTRSPGTMQPFRAQFFESALALNRGIRVLPVGIEHSGDKTVHVRYGAPFPCAGDLDAIVARCFEDVRRLSGI